MLAEMKKEMDEKMDARMEKMDARGEQMNARNKEIDEKMEMMDAKIDKQKDDIITRLNQKFQMDIEANQNELE